MHILRRYSAIFFIAVTAILIGTSSASAGESLRTTFLLSKSLSGGIPNGPSRNAAISHDQRVAKVAAFESDASDIAPGDTNGVTDVFMVFRAAGYGRNGTPWDVTPAAIASVGIGGVPANGRSWGPVIDGSSHTSPTCIGFVSEASNLVSGDTNGVADAFVRDLRTSRIIRVSVNSKGQQANGPTSEITVDGDCARVAFVSTATNLGLAKSNGVKASWSRAMTTKTSTPLRRVYVRIVKEKKHDKPFNGLTFIASSNARGVPANADSYGVAFAKSGKSVVFSSLASNLARGDSNGVSDVFQRTMNREFAHVNGKGVQVLVLDTNLVSGTGSGRPGNGASTHATVTDDGRYVAYETLADNLLPGDSNGVSDIVRADLKKARVKSEWVSKSYIGIGNGPSNNPVISDAGEFVLFDSDSTIFKASDAVAFDTNGVRDMFLWNAPSRNTSLESRDWDNHYLESPSSHPATSSRGNYVLFESADHAVDQFIGNNTNNPQVYLRYLGPQ